MTAPVTLPSAARMNAGGAYVVKVRERRLLHLDAPWAEDASGLEEYMASSILLGLRVTCEVETAGTVTPDGSLSVEPEPWAARHYRRAVMQGAGVYRWGLWAMLAPGRAAAEPDAQAGAALGVVMRFFLTLWAALISVLSDRKTSSEPNGIEQAEAFTCLLDTDPLPRAVRQRFDLMFSRGKFLSSGLPFGWDKQTSLDTPRIKYYLGLAVMASDLTRAYGAGFESGKVRYLFSLIYGECLTLEREATKRTLYRASIEALIKRGEAYRAHLARIVRPQRPPARAPRPLYARPRPPAAPLAPPALA